MNTHTLPLAHLHCPRVAAALLPKKRPIELPIFPRVIACSPYGFIVSTTVRASSGHLTPGFAALTSACKASFAFSNTR